MKDFSCLSTSYVGEVRACYQYLLHEHSPVVGFTMKQSSPRISSNVTLRTYIQWHE